MGGLLNGPEGKYLVVPGELSVPFISLLLRPDAWYISSSVNALIYQECDATGLTFAFHMRFPVL